MSRSDFKPRTAAEPYLVQVRGRQLPRLGREVDVVAVMHLLASALTAQ